MNMINFDSMAAVAAASIIAAAKKNAVKLSEADTRITTALNILTEQGIYAMALWLKEENYDWICSPLNQFFAKPENPLQIRNRFPSHEACLELSASLEKMFFAKQLIEQILTYARHMAKAEKGRAS